MSRFDRLAGLWDWDSPSVRRIKQARARRTIRRGNLLGQQLRAAHFQPLEERVMLDIGGANSLPPTIVVGRTLSAYDVPDVQNNQETLTFTVYNQAADPITGVLLTDTLESGVTFASASQLPDQNGQQLAWSLGTIQPYDRTSVSLTVTLSASLLGAGLLTPPQLDTGASAYGTLDAGMVTWSTARATLRTTAIAADLLASTPDANTTDPYVQEEAAQLHYDPTQIFNFLHTEIGYNSYVGSLRGARGTLWSSAGNSLDDASLGVALMRASGIPAQYEQGTLSQTQAQQLILSMFPASYQTVGYIPAGTQTSDPADDPTLLSETERHYWLQFDPGSGMTDADPEFSGQAVGTAATTSTGSFTEVPQSLRQTTEVSLTAEIYNQADAALTGLGGLTDTVVLDQTFNDVDLVGRPLTVGNLVSQTTIPSLTLVSQTNTYTPYFDLGDNAYPDPTHDEVFTGTNYQETLTNFPLGSQILTGLFLNITLSGAGTTPQILERSIVDRIGYAARQGDAPPPSLSVTPSDPPIITPLDLTTINALPALQSRAAIVAMQSNLGFLDSERKIVNEQISLASTSADQQSLIDGAAALMKEYFETLQRLQTSTFAYVSDIMSARQPEDIVAYYDSPRVLIAASQIVPASGSTVDGVAASIDLLKDNIRAIANPSQLMDATFPFQTLRGYIDSILEGEVDAVFPGNPVLTVFQIFQAAQAASIPFATITPANLVDLQAMQISDEAKARISAAVDEGKVVMLPSRMVTVNGKQEMGWYEYDPDTGALVATSANGLHPALTEGGGVDAAALKAELYSRFQQGVVIGAVAATFTELGVVIAVVGYEASFIKDLGQKLGNVVTATSAASGGALGAAAIASSFIDQAQKKIIDYASKTQGVRGLGIIAGFSIVYAFEKSLLKEFVGFDPPVPLGMLANAGATPVFPLNRSSTSNMESSRLGAGTVASSASTSSLSVSGSLAATWASTSTSTLPASSVEATNATVINSLGVAGGSGVVAFSGQSPTDAMISGDDQYSVTGSGSLSFYGPSESSIGVSGDWDSYSATVAGDVSITLTVAAGALTVNGQTLPAGTYTITTSSANVSGSGTSNAPDFAGSASITVKGGVVELGPGTGNLTVGGAPINTATETTMTDYSGTVNVSANGNGTDAETLSGNAANVLTMAPSPEALTTDQNTPVSFNAGVQTSFAGTYNLTANAPMGWTVTIDSSGNVTVTPAPGTQSGGYAVQVIAQSTANPDLVSQATVEVTVTATTPGMTFAVNPDPVFTVPFDRAQVPSAYRATIQNTGPVADTYNLTFGNVPAGWTIVDSGTSDTVPAGATGILGIYLEPTGSTLPAPGTQVSFTVIATSATDASITKSVTVTFTMPAIAAATVTSDPLAVSTTPGTATTATVTIMNVGNVPYNAALATTTDSGLTISGLSSPGMIPLGQSVTETATLTPDASTALNTTLNATVNVDQAATTSWVSVVAVNASPVSGATSPHPGPLPEGEGEAVAGQTVDITSDVQSEVSAQETGSASFRVMNASGSTVFTSTAVPVTLSTIGELDTVDLGTFNTAGFAPGQFTISVTVDDSSGNAIAGAMDTTTLTVSLPVSASVSVDTDSQTPGPVTSTETLNVTSNAVIGNVATDNTATSMAVDGTIAYVASTQDISVVDISNPTSPQVLSTFGSKDLNLGGESGFNLLGIAGIDLIVASQEATASSINFLVYSLANPQSPSLLGSAVVPYLYLNGMTIEGTTAYLSTFGQTYDANGDVVSQTGDLVAVDFSNPATPVIGESLYNDVPQPFGHGSFVFQSAEVSTAGAAMPQLLVAGSTSTGANTQTGTGQVTVVNTGAGGTLSAGATLTIPGTVQTLGVAVDGTQALVVGSTGGSVSPFGDPSQIGISGNVTLTLLDITNPASPTVIGTTVVTQNTFQPVGAYPLGTITVVALGNRQFAINGTLANGSSVVLTVDASNPNSLVTSNLSINASASGLTLAGGQLFGAAADGLTIYQPAALVTTPTTVTVTVPTNGVSIVPNSFSLAPASITNGTNSETLTWNLNVAPGTNQQITWQTNSTNLQAEQVQPVVTGGTLQFTLPGQSATTVLLPAANVAGVPTPISVTIPVEVAAPGVPAIESAAVAAQNLNITGLSQQLTDLGIALTNLVGTPTSNVYLGQATAALASLITLVTNDPFLSGYTVDLATAQAALSAANTPAEIQSAIGNLGTALDSLAQAITDYALHGFTLSLASNQALALPGALTLFTVQLQNTGTETTTYDLSVSGLPAGVTAQFSQPSITLAPGASIPQGTTTVTLSLSQSGTALIGGSFTVTATAEGAPETTLSTQGQLTLLAESLAVPVVTVTPPFTQPNGAADVTAKIQSVVNEPRTLSVSYTVTDPNGNVIYTDPNPQTVSLTNTTGLSTVDLGDIDTTGFVDGVDTVTVTVSDQSSQPLPSASGTANLIIGLPVSASITTSPGLLPANIAEGPLNVTTTLSVNAQTPFPDPLTLDGQVQTTPSASNLALYQSGGNDLAYVAGTNGIDIVDVTDPASPVDKGAFGTSDIVQGGVTIARIANIGGADYLVVGTTATLNANQFTLLIYSLADPLAPAKVSETAFDYEFMNELLVDGTTLLVPTAGLGFFATGLDDEYGTVLSIDISNPAAPVLDSELYNNRGMPEGGDTQQIGGGVVQSGLAYITSTTETGGGGFTFNPGVGRVLVVDDSNPASLSVSKEVDIPGTEQGLAIGIQGNEALVVSSTAGPTGNLSNYGQASGNLVLSLLDISNPASPQLIGTSLITADTFGTKASNTGGAISALPLGNGLFAVSGAVDNGTSVLLLVDPTDPNNIVVSATPLPVGGNEMAVSGNILYATSSQGLTTYLIGPIEHTSYTASVEVPTDANTSIVSGSFNIPPTSITTGTNFDTLTWVRQLAFGQDQQTFSWQTQARFLAAGEVRPVTLGTSLSFVSQATPGSFDLPATSVTGEPLAEVLPSASTMLPGSTATFDLRLFNPTNAAVRYHLQAEIGISSTNSLPTTTATEPVVGPGATVDLPFQITAGAFDRTGVFASGIVVYGEPPANSNGSTGASDEATFNITVAGTPVLPTPDAHGVAVNLTPTQASAGLNDLATYTVQVTNTGSVADTFVLNLSGTSGLFNQYFSQNSVTVQPGASNFKDVTLTLQPDVVDTPGDENFTVSATSQTTSGITATANGTLTILPLGVYVNLAPTTNSTAPGAPYQVVVENAGQTTDTFDLSLAGPAAQIASLASTQTMTLAPGSSQRINITTSAADFADAGSLPLTVVATSQTNPQVQSTSTANLTVPSTQSVSASFLPPTQSLAAPGATSFLLQVNNTGNTEDQYSATITGTTGAITASLIGLDGQPTQSVPLFILPGLAQGAILLDVAGLTPGQGTVTVTIQSLTNSTESTTATATVDIASPAQMQVALVSNSGLSPVEGSTTPIGSSALQAAVSGSSTSASGLVFTLTSVPSSGSLLLNGQALAAGDTFTQDDINSGRLSYKATEEGADSFGFNVAASGAVGTGGTFVIATSDPAVDPTGGFTYSATAGTTPATQTVATFTDPGGTETLADYSATIDWGDGSGNTAGTITFNTQTQVFTVSGQHSYAHDGTLTIQVALKHEAAPTVTATSTADVAPASITGGSGIVATGTPFQGYEYSSPTAVPVATFTDGNGSLPVGDFSATVDWGDGTSSTGSISLSSGTYTVTGAHEYLDEGVYAATVSIAQTAGPVSGGATSALVSAKATIHEQLLENGTVGTPNQNWIQEVYRDLFDRQAERQGLDYWVSELAQGVPRQEVAYQMIQIASFEEYQHDTVAALYEQYLGRAPDAGGLAYWSAYLYQGGTIESMSQALVSSPEFYHARGGGSASGYLQALFQTALGRQIDSPSLAFFEQQMAQGESAAQVAATVFGSDEYHRIRVNELFEQFLERSVDPGAMAYFAGQLDNGDTDQFVITQLVSSDEYFDHAQ